MRTLFALALSAVSLTAESAAVTGYISDNKCALSGAKARTAAEWIKPAAFEKCVKDCVKDGSDAVFVTEDNKILKFDAASVAKITPYLGRKVSVTGKSDGSTLTVGSVTALKMPEMPGRVAALYDIHGNLPGARGRAAGCPRRRRRSDRHRRRRAAGADAARDAGVPAWPRHSGAGSSTATATAR